MNVFSIQLITLLCLFVGNILFGLLPLLFSKITGRHSSGDQEWLRKIKIATFLLYFGGGVFISNSFLILLPEAHEHFESRESHNHAGSEKSPPENSKQESSGHHHDSFPIPEFLVLCGFFIAYVLQELIYFIFFKLKNNSRQVSDMRVSFCSCAKRHTECSRTYKDARPDQTLFGQKLIESANASPSACSIIPNGPPEMTATANTELLRSSIMSQTVPNYGAVTNIVEPPVESALPVLSAPVLLAEERRLAMEQHIAIRDQNKLLLSAMLTIIALALQYTFLGMAIGLRAMIGKEWPYLVVLCVQNFILTFSAGSDLATSNMKPIYLATHISLLSIFSPVGVIISMTQKQFVDTIPHIAKGTVAAVACGILLYTTFHEILRRKRLGSAHGLTKFCAITLGASTMASLQYILML